MNSRQRNSLLRHGKIINGKSDPDYQLMTSLPMFDRSIHANARNAIVVVVLVDVTAAAIAVGDVDVVGIVYSLCIGKVCVAPRLQAQSALISLTASASQAFTIYTNSFVLVLHICVKRFIIYPFVLLVICIALR
ncbi:hypothetical protein T05_16405 [Trichinella murrelli]|uniref:Uncharacterized protein n=1 Tax=Trichinella murrelli TaxID=144512 RepID=A0A0V0TFQ3_9BILA|nr:hypothetical protein T05_16405 [Trichinella murrelli]